VSEIIYYYPAAFISHAIWKALELLLALWSVLQFGLFVDVKVSYNIEISILIYAVWGFIVHRMYKLRVDADTMVLHD